MGIGEREGRMREGGGFSLWYNVAGVSVAVRYVAGSRIDLHPCVTLKVRRLKLYDHEINMSCLLIYTWHEGC